NKKLSEIESNLGKIKSIWFKLSQASPEAAIQLWVDDAGDKDREKRAKADRYIAWMSNFDSGRREYLYECIKKISDIASFEVVWIDILTKDRFIECTRNREGFELERQSRVVDIHLVKQIYEEMATRSIGLIELQIVLDENSFGRFLKLIDPNRNRLERYVLPRDGIISQYFDKNMIITVQYFPFEILIQYKKDEMMGRLREAFNGRRWSRLDENSIF
ncbi:hypothetical protein PFISCL1PPCAC_19211, partial [Pristionchus fissidentatus]